MKDIKLHDLVALLVDLPEQNLERGDVGTVVDVLEESPHHSAGLIVEFVGEGGRVRGLADVTDDSQVVRLNLRREAA